MVIGLVLAPRVRPASRPRSRAAGRPDRRSRGCCGSASGWSAA
ncbi:hypothetical protein [Nannocystis pusilla]